MSEPLFDDASAPHYALLHRILDALQAAHLCVSEATNPDKETALIALITALERAVFDLELRMGFEIARELDREEEATP